MSHDSTAGGHSRADCLDSRTAVVRSRSNALAVGRKLGGQNQLVMATQLHQLAVGCRIPDPRDFVSPLSNAEAFTSAAPARTCGGILSGGAANPVLLPGA